MKSVLNWLTYWYAYIVTTILFIVRRMDLVDRFITMTEEEKRTLLKAAQRQYDEIERRVNKNQ